MHRIIRRQAGDTIVEVLIAMVVIASVLAGAFVVSRSSLGHVRDSEEHAQALNILQGQLEQLRAFAGTASAAQKTKILDNGPFCIKDGLYYPATDANCKQLGDNDLYDVSLVHGVLPDTTGTYTFQGTITWNTVNGHAGQEQLVYRLSIN